MAKRPAKKRSKTTARGGIHISSHTKKLPPSMEVGGGDITISSDASTDIVTITISKGEGDVMVIEGGGGVGGGGGK